MEPVLRQLPRSGGVRDVVRAGAGYVRTLCGRRGPGLVLLKQILGQGEEADLVLASLEELAEEFAASVDTSLKT
jgi:hypothetical protein